MTAREKIIHAMARAMPFGSCHPTDLLALIAEHGCAIVPRDGPDKSSADACSFQQAHIAFDKGCWDDWKCAFYREMIAAVDIAAPANLAGEALR